MWNQEPEGLGSSGMHPSIRRTCASLLGNGIPCLQDLALLRIHWILHEILEWFGLEGSLKLMPF